MYSRYIGEKHEDVMAKFGAILAQVRDFTVAISQWHFQFNDFESFSRSKKNMRHKTKLAKNLRRIIIQIIISVFLMISFAFYPGYHWCWRQECDCVPAISDWPHQHDGCSWNASLHPGKLNNMSGVFFWQYFFLNQLLFWAIRIA